MEIAGYTALRKNVSAASNLHIAQGNPNPENNVSIVNQSGTKLV